MVYFNVRIRIFLGMDRISNRPDIRPPDIRPGSWAGYRISGRISGWPDIWPDIRPNRISGRRDTRPDIKFIKLFYQSSVYSLKSRISGVDIRPTGYPASRISGRIVNLISGRIRDIKKSRISGMTGYPVHPYLKSNCLDINVFKMFKI